MAVTHNVAIITPCKRPLWARNEPEQPDHVAVGQRGPHMAVVALRAEDGVGALGVGAVVNHSFAAVAVVVSKSSRPGCGGLLIKVPKAP